MPVLYEMAIYIQDEFLEQFYEENGYPGEDIRFEFNDVQSYRKHLDLSQVAFRRQFDEEQHNCGICNNDKLGANFFFMSGCEHYFCLDCMHQMVTQKINDGQIAQLKCAEATCGKMVGDHDIKNLNLGAEMYKKYEKLSVDNAIAQMDDMGWCPLPTCSQIANIDKFSNSGRCTFCDFHFCLDCRERTHPFKRCIVHRLDIQESFQKNEDILAILKRNHASEEVLNKLFMKYCTKSCPNNKCGVPISLDKSDCMQV